ADPPGELANTKRLRGRAHAARTMTGSASTSTPACSLDGTRLGRMSDTAVPTSEIPASTHIATWRLWMDGSSRPAATALETPEKIEMSTFCGTAEVTIAITSAIDSTAPVF